VERVEYAAINEAKKILDQFIAKHKNGTTITAGERKW
jgi:hypothetical protein